MPGLPDPQATAAAAVAATGTPSARAHALAVLRIRGTALAAALLPAAVAVVLFAAHGTGRTGGTWDGLRWAVTALAVLVLAVAAGVATVIARARPAVTPTVGIERSEAPDLYTLVRELADRLDVPVPSAIALTPDCDSWLEDRTHPAQEPRGERQGGRPGSDRAGHGHTGRAPRRRVQEAPVLVIGSPFLWWMRVAELRALLAPVVAGTGPSAHPDIAAARRFVRSLDAAVAVADRARAQTRAARLPGAEPAPGHALRRAVLRFTGWLARLMLRGCGPHAAEMERGVAAAAADRAQHVDRGLRTTAQEQVGLAYAGWDRLLTRVALPAWRTGRWPSRLDAGVVSALTELSRRDRLAEGFASRLGERPACDLLEEPGTVDASVSLLAARLFHGDPREARRAQAGRDAGGAREAREGTGQAQAEWSPVDWPEYPEEVVDRIWRTDASRLFEALEATASGDRGTFRTGLPRDEIRDAARQPVPQTAGHRSPPGAGSREDGALAHSRGRDEHLRPAAGASGGGPAYQEDTGRSLRTDDGPPVRTPDGGTPEEAPGEPFRGATLGRLLERLSGPEGARGDAVATRISAVVAREDAERGTAPTTAGDGTPPGGSLPSPMGLPLRPPRTGRELMAEHVTAAVCCAAVDTAGAAPGLDWLDGPALLVDGERVADLARPVLDLVEDGDPAPLRAWLAGHGVRTDKPVRLV